MRFLLLLTVTVLFSCKNQAQIHTEQQKVKHAIPVEVPLDNGIAKAYFASGCFWCVEAIYESVKGVHDAGQKAIIATKKEALSKKLNVKIAAEVYPFQKFWIGENYHQNYERLHPNQGYIRNVSIPRLKRFQAKMPEVLKEVH